MTLREINVCGKTIAVRQLTVRGVNEYLDSQPEPPTAAELLMNRDVPERVVRACTGLTSAELNGEVTPDELAKLWDAVEEANPFLSGLIGRLMTAGRGLVEMVEARRSPGQDSAAAPAPSPGGTGIPA